MNKAIFFDRDGVINYRLVGDYVKSPAEFAFCPDLIPFLKLVKEKGYLAIIITNQQGVSKGLMSEEDLKEVHTQMQNQLVAELGYAFDDIYYCTAPSCERFSRRKPNPDMILEAVEKHSIDKSKSWIIGDSITDIIAGEKAEIGTVYLGTDIMSNPFINPIFKFKNLADLQAYFSDIENYSEPFQEQ